MTIKILMLLILGIISVAGSCFAQAREPGSGGVSSSTGTWASVDSSQSSIDGGSAAGYGSGDHGNVS